MKHTSGPWKIEQYQSTHKCHDVNFRCQSDAPDGLTKCAYSDRGRVSILQETHGSQVVICDMAKNKNNGYDARLIAAAPEMLDALKYAADIIILARDYFPKSIKNPDKFELENTCAAINKAIALAEGR